LLDFSGYTLLVQESFLFDSSPSIQKSLHESFNEGTRSQKRDTYILNHGAFSLIKNNSIVVVPGQQGI